MRKNPGVKMLPGDAKSPGTAAFFHSCNYTRLKETWEAAQHAPRPEGIIWGSKTPSQVRQVPQETRNPMNSMSTNYMVTLDMFECVAESDPNRSLPWHHKT